MTAKKQDATTSVPKKKKDQGANETKKSLSNKIDKKKQQ
jgi:hypothetical protein